MGWPLGRGGRRGYGSGGMPQFGSLTGGGSLVPRRPVMIKPYLLGGVDRPAAVGAAAPPPARHVANAGLDAKVGLPLGFTCDLTANTDFSQLDADDHQINLPRFDAFFPANR